MTVLFDDRGFRMKFGGIPRYFTEIIKRFPADIKWQVVAWRSENVFLQAAPFNIKGPEELYTRKVFVDKFLGGHYVRGLDRLFGLLYKLFPKSMGAYRIVNERMFRAIARHRDVNIIHLTEPHYYNYDWESTTKGKKIVVTVHDLIPDMVWNYEWMQPYRKKVLERADAIIAVSNYTKDRIVEFYGIPPDKITVVYHGYLEYLNQVDETLFPGKRYILYVGNRNSYKNFPFFVRAISPLIKSHTDLFLVCTGPAFNDEEKELFVEQGVLGKVIHAFVADSQMQSLYSHAEAFVYPSQVEGFGIPILDAFAARCPVVLSNCSCFPEIAKDAALYFDDGDDKTLRETIEMLMKDSVLRATMIAKGLDRVKEFSWQKCADETVAVYKKVLRK